MIRKLPAYYIFVSIAIIALDQLSKWLVIEHIIRTKVMAGNPVDLISWLFDAPARIPYAEINILPFFNLVMVWNKGVSFGLFNQETDYGPLVLIILSVLIIMFFCVWLFKTKSKFQALGIALVIGGAFGNIIDRIRFGAVVDFLDFYINNYHWPAFNLADSCIVLGVALLILYSFIFEKEYMKE